MNHEPHRGAGDTAVAGDPPDEPSVLTAYGGSALDRGSSSGGDGKPRMLVIAACPFPANRGTPSRILRMAESLLDHYRVDVVTYPLSEDVRVDPGLSIHRVRNVFGYDKRSPGPSLTKPLLDLRLVPLVRSLAARNEYDVVYAHHVEGCAVGLLWKRLTGSDTELVYDVHGSLTDELEQFGFLYNRFSRPLWAGLERRLLAGADKLVCVSADLRASVLEAGLAEGDEVTVVPTGIRYDEFRSLIGGTSPFPHDRPTVTYAGSMAPYQNLTELPDVVEAVVERLGPVEFRVVAGEAGGPAVQRVVEAARDRGVDDRLAVRTGVPFSAVPTYLHHSDVLINLRTECSGVPQKLVNYMAAGRPIVSAAGSAKPLEDGENAVVVADHDTAAFADAVVELLTDPVRAASLGRRAAEDARSYDWDRLAGHLREFLE